MRLVDDGGQVMDAEFVVEADGRHLAVVMESRSGSAPGRAPRNQDYQRTLTILLTRLGKLNAVLVDALVDSRRTQALGLPESDRRLIQAPTQLAQEPDLEALRRQLGTAQSKIAQAPDATKGGNSTKRIRLRVSVPGFQPSHADRLAQALITPAPSEQTDETANSRQSAAQGDQELETTSLSKVLETLASLRMQHTDGGLPKRHQPLTLLWAIGKARQEDRLTPWPAARPQIEQLISAFGRPTDRPNAYLPFLALASTDLWELTAKPPPKGPGPDARRAWLAETAPPVAGGLSSPVYNLLATDTDAAATVVAQLLDAHFEDIDTDMLLEGAGLDDLADSIDNQNEQQAARTVLSVLTKDSAVIAAEAFNTESITYERKSSKVIVRRAESQLVDTYKQTLPPGKAVRLQLAVGFTDLYDEETGDIIEAKVSAQHRYVRQALGQLLDYAAHCTKPVNKLTALFPDPPSSDDVNLLHQYGIDCLHLQSGKFIRLKAPSQARERIRATWAQRN